MSSKKKHVTLTKKSIQKALDTGNLVDLETCVANNCTPWNSFYLEQSEFNEGLLVFLLNQARDSVFFRKTIQFMFDHEYNPGMDIDTVSQHYLLSSPSGEEEHDTEAILRAKNLDIFYDELIKPARKNILIDYCWMIIEVMHPIYTNFFEKIMTKDLLLSTTFKTNTVDKVYTQEQKQYLPNLFFIEHVWKGYSKDTLLELEMIDEILMTTKAALALAPETIRGDTLKAFMYEATQNDYWDGDVQTKKREKIDQFWADVDLKHLKKHVPYVHAPKKRLKI